MLLRILNPWVWGTARRASRKYYSFANAEQGSMIDLMEAARLTTSAKRAALYLRHANDESRHAHVFASRSAQLRQQAGLPSLGPPRPDTEGLFYKLGEAGFLAFVYIGEGRGLRQFESYQAYFERSGSVADGAIFSGIASDEARHESYTLDLLVELCGSEKNARRAVQRARRWRLWRGWRRMGRGTAGGIYQFLMVAIYVAIAPFSILVKILSHGDRGWRRGA